MNEVQLMRGTARHPGYAGFRATLKLVGTGPRGSRDLTLEEARDALTELLGGEVSPAQAGAFLIATRIKGESPEEMAGYAQALRDAAVPLAHSSRRPLVACAGAYDGTGEAPQLSIAAGVVAAACGAAIVIHCGSALGPKYGATARDVLAVLGGPGAPTPAESEAMLERSGVTVVDTSQAVAGWESLLELRNELGLRGPVHSAEKLIDYFGARRFVVGYTHAAYAERLLGALRLLGGERAVAVRGIEGSDVMRPGRPVAHDFDGKLELPEHLGERLSAAPGGAESAARLTQAILDGSARGPERAAVVLSAAVRLYAAGLVRDSRDGIDLAAEAISSGRADDTLAAMLAH
ncbi:MAG: anthranilate phosphoribosyltransferase [Solirubrobacteraceae bacterium]